MVDELAEALDMDPLRLRAQNDPNPVRQAQYELGAREIGWDRRKKSGSESGPVKRGLGVASARWGHTGRPGCAVRCRIGKDGSVLIANGAQDLGTGTRTVLAMVGAEELGLTPADVEVRLGNTNDPYGHASGGSVTAPSITPAARTAAYQAKRQLLDHVAGAVGTEAKELDLKAGRVVGGKKQLTFAQACGLMPTDAIDVTGQAGPASFGMARFTREVAGVQFAEVEVDTRTGRVRVLRMVAVQDCGLVVNPLTARSQINGGVIQGISYALFENRLLDARSGNMVNADFLGYKILGALDMPEIVAIPLSVTNGISNSGVSSLGEPPTTPTAAAVANAVANAIGVRIRSLPITPDKVLAALGGAR
jgi:xanthine dehydrogenase YagR molybdenum-binding subunit